MNRIIKRIQKSGWLVFVMGMLVAACGRLQPTEPAEIVSTLTGTLPVEVVSVASVGQPIELLVGPTQAADGTPIFLTLIGSYGPQVLRAQFKNDIAYFLIPAEMTTRSGQLDLVVTSGQAKGNAILELLPDTPVEPITPLVGARSIIADSNHWAMVVAIPFDQFGNPIAEETNVDVRSLHPGDTLRNYRPKVKHLLAWERIYSGVKAGRTIVAVNIEDVHGPEAILLEIPGWPIPFPLVSDRPTLPADGFQLMTVQTAKITDQYGNLMPDGTLVNFVVDGPVGNMKILPAVTVDGVAETIVQAPREPGEYMIRATVFGMESEPLIVEFTPGPAVSKFPITFEINTEKGELALTAGPITAALDQYVPDGTFVTFNIVGPNGKIHSTTAATDAGYATGTLRLLQLGSGPHEIQATAGSGNGTLSLTLP